MNQLNDVCGIWLFGPRGSGKEYSIYSLFGDSLYVKISTKWRDGYNNEKHVLISDVEPFHSGWLDYYLKIWADRYPFMAEIKGGSMQIRPLKTVVTSKFKIEQMFNGSVYVAIWRRFDKIYLLEHADISVIKRGPVTQKISFFQYLKH